MTQRERRGWFIVAALFITLVLVFGGGYDTVPVFLPALLRGFPKWSRAEVSLLPSVLALSAGLSVLPVGWLVDRIEARLVMITGALLAGGAFLLASASHSLGTMMAAYLVLGIGISAGTVLPATLVLANWFTERRGLAMGIALSGSTVGGSLMTLVAGHLFPVTGWRTAYIVLAVPMVAVAVPLVALVVRSRPPGSVRMTVAESAELLEGFETNEALRTRSFWMIVLANFCFAFTAAGSAIHLVAYLEGVGYKSSAAAVVMSLVFAFAALGKVIMGFVADRLTARIALVLCFLAEAAGLSIVFSAGRMAGILAFVPIYGMSIAAPLMLLPLLTAESLGIKRYGFLSGLGGLAQTFGAMVGPIVAGRIFDMTASYSVAFEIFIAVMIVGAGVAYSCRSYDSERARMISLPGRHP
ncbi:MAG TPA: MFS transporter, partial [Candidatus Binataceae bacterium]|nr:MFS transporter [Candidatus Binataceae bacterium]